MGGEPTSATLRRQIQDGLRRLSHYRGPVDGAWAPETIKGIQRFTQAQNLYNGPADGAVGKNTVIGGVQLREPLAPIEDK
ncbi:peptidoglycan-binding domain-containing protein [Gulosibacter bifidus]|uniref:Peptidoglycan-binding domain-containing protein n=1 Tax=Gulosibacter bifidus TaxID=272239 RepID=A0ABW5RIG5_9MICO